MTSRKIIVALAFLVSASSYAQEAGSTSDSTVATKTDALYETYAQRSALALNLSVTGIGLEYARNLNQHFNGRLRLNYATLNDYTTELEFSEQPVLIVGNIDVFNADLALEYLPFKRSSFKLVVGGSMFFDAGGSAQISYNGELEYGDITISKEEVGDITVGLDYSGFAPYLGLGFGRAVPKKRVGFGIEMGAYYAGSPEVTLTATEMFAPTATEERDQLAANLSDYKWLPYINMRLAIKL